MYESWYQDHYHEMSNAGRWFSGRGINLLSPDEWEQRPYRVLIVRLSTARDTADSFTHQLLYQIATSCVGVFADSAWLPPPEDAMLFDKYNIPWMTGVVTKRPAAHFDCIALSNSIIQEIINIPTLLLKSNIPIGKRERIGRSDVPMVILGGANALFTSALLCDDPSVDAIFVGEDESLIQKIFTIGQKGKAKEKGKRAILKELTNIPGFVEPDCPKTTMKPVFPLSDRQQLRGAPVFAGEGNIGAASLQISEGCPCFCAFCAESWSRKPYRERDATACAHSALAMKAAMGLSQIDLYSFNFNMHSQLREIIFELCRLFSSVGLKSQRLDGIAEDPELMPLLHAINKSSITVGIEGISGRLRARLQKGLPEKALNVGLMRLCESPIRELKLFFLATGKEEAADIDEFRKLLTTVSEAMQRVNRFPRIIISMTSLVRFPFTPLERETAPDGGVVREIILQCERIARSKQFEFRSAATMNEYLFSQIFVRANDPRMWQALCDAIAETSFVYYRDIPDKFMETLFEQLFHYGLTKDALLKGTGNFGRMPIRLCVKDAFLEKLKQSSDAFQDLGYCLGSYQAADKCLGCGACEDEKQKLKMIAMRPRHSLRGEKLKELASESNKTVSVSIKCFINATQRGVSRHLIAAEMARRFMALDPLLLRTYRGFKGSLIADLCESEWIHGNDVITLLFQEKAAAKLGELCNDNRFLDRIHHSLAHRGEMLAIIMEPPAQQQITLRIATAWKCDPASYCKEHSLKHIATRTGDGWMNYQFTKDSLKKRILLSMKMRREEAESTLEIILGEKFVYNEFIRSAIALPTERHIVRIFCEARISRPLFGMLKSDKTNPVDLVSKMRRSRYDESNQEEDGLTDVQRKWRQETGCKNDQDH